MKKQDEFPYLVTKVLLWLVVYYIICGTVILNFNITGIQSFLLGCLDGIIFVIFFHKYLYNSN